MKNFILLLLITSFTYAQSTISGLVVDKKTNLPLADANILIKSDSFDSGTSSGNDGKFTFLNLNEGKYFLEVSLIGYETTCLPDPRKRRVLSWEKNSGNFLDGIKVL